MKHPSDATREALARDLAKLCVVRLTADRPVLDWMLGLGAMVALALGAASAWAWIVILWMD